MTREWINVKPLFDKENSATIVEGREVFSAWIPSDDILGIEFWRDHTDMTFNISVLFKTAVQPITLSFDNPTSAWNKWKVIQGALGIKGYEKRGPKKVIFEKFKPDEYTQPQLSAEGEYE